MLHMTVEDIRNAAALLTEEKVPVTTAVNFYRPDSFTLMAEWLVDCDIAEEPLRKKWRKMQVSHRPSKRMTKECN